MLNLNLNIVQEISRKVFWLHPKFQTREHAVNFKKILLHTSKSEIRCEVEKFSFIDICPFSFKHHDFDVVNCMKSEEEEELFW